VPSLWLRQFSRSFGIRVALDLPQHNEVYGIVAFYAELFSRWGVSHSQEAKECKTGVGRAGVREAWLLIGGEQIAVIISRRYYANSIGYPPESASSSKTWHAWFASRCPGRHLSTRPTTAVSCPTALGALCDQLTFRRVVPRTLSSYGDSTFAAAGPRMWNSLLVQLRNPGIACGLFRRQLRGHLFREAWTRRSVTSDMRCHRNTLTWTGLATFAASSRLRPNYQNCWPKRLTYPSIGDRRL